MNFPSRNGRPGLPVNRLTIPKQTFNPSGSPSPTTANGRPPKWTVLTVWTLVTAYLNTSLQIPVLLKIVEHFADDPSSVPKEESAHKKIASIAGKELRWARPGIGRALKCVKSHICAPEFLRRMKINDKELQFKAPDFVDDASHFDGDDFIMQPPTRKDTSLSVKTTNSMEEGIDAISKLISTSTEDAPATYLRSLSKYLYILIKNASVVLGKNIHQRAPSESPTDYSLDRDSWSNSSDAPHDRDAPRLVPWDLLRPTAPLSLNQKVPCLDGTFECLGTQQDHRNQHCMCHLQDALNASLWMQKIDATTNTTHLKYMMNTCQISRYTDLIDCFGNTALHMLAINAAQPAVIINAAHNTMREQAKLMNSLGQSFLHLLDRNWLTNESLLVQLLDPLSQDTRLFLGRDHYGRTFFHSLWENAGDDLLMQMVLKSVMMRFNVKLSPDSFNSCPSYAETASIPGVQVTPAEPFPMPNFDYFDFQTPFDPFAPVDPFRRHSRRPSSRSIMSNMSDDVTFNDFALFPPASGTPSLSGHSHVMSHSKRLTIVNQAFHNPGVTDEYGRNGLHCLGSAITSLRTMKDEHDSLSLGTHHRRRKHSNASQCSASPSTFSNSESTLSSPTTFLAPPGHIDIDFVPTSPIDEAQILSSKEDASQERMAQRIQWTKGLIDAGVDVNAFDHGGNTPLMTYVANSFEWSLDRQKPLELIRMLIVSGANIHSRNRKGETALHIAARCGRKNAVRVLIDEGANVNARDGNGNSVFDILDRQFYSRQDSDKQVHVREITQFHLIKSYITKATEAVQDPSVLDEWRMMTPKKMKRSSASLKKRPLAGGEDSTCDDEALQAKKRR